MTTVSPRLFSDASAVISRGDGLLDGAVDPEWTIRGKPNGGYLLAMLGRALRIAVALVVVASLGLPAAAVASAGTGQALASSLTRDPVQSIGVPKDSFTSLLPAQISSLRAQIAKRDPGRIWILIVSPRSQNDLGDLADPVFSDLPAGTLIAVAEDPADANQTNFWVSSSWQDSDTAQSQLNDVITGYRKGQGSLFEDLRLVIRSFASGDDAAGHPGGGSGGNSGSGGGGGAGLALLIIVIVAIVAMLIVGGMMGVPYLRGVRRVAHRRREQSADAHAQANKDLAKLADQISGLDIDSSMSGASEAGKDAYAQALDCYQDAEKRLGQSGDDYQFERAVDAIKRGLELVGKADRLFNPNVQK
jgi:hypothetical protein